MTKKEPLVSVVIPARNEQDYVSEALQSILGQSYSRLEAVVVNDGSTDRTRQIVAGIARGDRRVRLYNFPKGHSAAFARNYGAKMARGQVLVFHDADAVADRDYIASIMRTMGRLKLDGVSNKTLAAGARTFISRCIAAQRSLLWDTRQKETVAFDESAPTLIASFKATAFRKLGGYNEKIFYFEDGDLTKRFLQAGFKAAYEPSAVERHHDPDSLDETIRQARWFGKGIAYNLREKGEAKPLLAPAYSVLLTLALIAAAVGFAFFGAGLAGRFLAMLAVLLVPLAAYCAWMAVKSSDWLHSFGFGFLFWLRNNVKFYWAISCLAGWGAKR